MDFTLSTYKALIQALIIKKYNIITLKSFIQNCMSESDSHVVILRHDVDRLPLYSLLMAQLDYDLGVSASYYFRMVSTVFNEDVIRRIADLGHEIGYHYETMDTCNGNISKAYDEFCCNLEHFRKIYPVKTICMHGNPTSQYDNRMLWGRYDYKKLGLVAESYLDLDFTKVLYLTDTGRRWNGVGVNIKDKVCENPGNTQAGKKGQRLANEFCFNNTFDLIQAIYDKKLPGKIMINTHPQRWADKAFPWFKELIGQNIKNIFKFIVVKSKNGY